MAHLDVFTELDERLDSFGRMTNTFENFDGLRKQLRIVRPAKQTSRSVGLGAFVAYIPSDETAAQNFSCGTKFR